VVEPRSPAFQHLREHVAAEQQATRDVGPAVAAAGSVQDAVDRVGGHHALGGADVEDLANADNHTGLFAMRAVNATAACFVIGITRPSFSPTSDTFGKPRPGQPCFQKM
jgi:hypothetical protein